MKSRLISKPNDEKRLDQQAQFALIINIKQNSPFLQ
jgi:hypothetical protein